MIVAEEIGLVGKQGATIDGITGLVNTAANDIYSDASAGIPNIPPIDAVLLPAASASRNVVLGYTIEGINDVEPHIRHHAIAFYNKLIPVFEEASAQFFLMSHEKYHAIVGSLQSINDGEPLATLWRNYPNSHCWNKNYSIIDDGVGGHILVMRPKLTGDNDTADIKNLKQVTCLE